MRAASSPRRARQLGRDLVPAREQVLEEEVVVDPAHPAGSKRRRREARERARERRGVARAQEVLLEADLLLRQDVADARGVGKARLAPDLARDGGKRVHALRERGGAHHERRVGKGEVLVARVRLAEEVEPSEVRLDEGVKLGGGVSSRVQPAEKVGEHADPRQLPHGEAAQVEVVVDVVDAVRVELVGDAGQRRLDVDWRRLRRGRLDVGDGELRQGRERLGGVRGLLLRAQRGDLLAHGGELVVSHAGAQALELGGLLVRCALGDGHELHLGGVGARAHELSEQALEEAVVEPLLELGERVLVAQVVCRAIVVVEPARERLDGEGDAVGVAAPVALAQVELGLGDRGLELVAQDAPLGELGAGGLHELAELLSSALAQALEQEDRPGAVPRRRRAGR